jgi:hypothetical protein
MLLEPHGYAFGLRAAYIIAIRRVEIVEFATKKLNLILKRGILSLKSIQTTNNVFARCRRITGIYTAKVSI